MKEFIFAVALGLILSFLGSELVLKSFLFPRLHMMIDREFDRQLEEIMRREILKSMTVSVNKA